MKKEFKKKMDNFYLTEKLETNFNGREVEVSRYSDNDEIIKAILKINGRALSMDRDEIKELITMLEWSLL